MPNSIFVMILSYLVTTIFLIFLEKKISILYKIRSRIKVKKQYIPVACVTASMIAILLLGIVGIYIVNLSNEFMYIFSGIILGFTIQLISIKE